MVDQVIALLQREGRATYRALQREFDLDEPLLADLKDELIDAKRLAVDENGKVLVWVGEDRLESSVPNLESEKHKKIPVVPTLDPRPKDPPRPNVSERRQITVLFCDLVGSTTLSTQLDPEDYQTLVQTYHQTCAEVIRRHEGYVAQPLGDGVLVYFGYPTAHEDDARRAIRTGLEMLEAVRAIPLPPLAAALFSPSPLQGEGSASRASAGEGRGKDLSQDSPHPHLLPVGAKGLQVRIGVHTGLVVVGEIGSGERRERLALGETPNLAARIQGLAEPNTVLMSAATQRLVNQQFESQPFGSHLLKGFATPIAVYHVQSERHGISPLAGKETLTPLVGREQEVGLLLDRWEQTKEGRGQVILLSGEPGIGKSRLTLTLKDQVTQDSSLLYEARCSPYHQHSALYPLIEGMQRTLLFTRQDSEEQKIAKLAQVLTLYEMPDTLPLFTALLSLPTPAQSPPLNLTPQKQKERTFQALLQLMAAQAERQAAVSLWEDLHWADPSSLEFLSLLIEQIPTTKLLLVLTFRPEFRPPWPPRSHLSQLVLNRLGKRQVEAMIAQAAAEQHLPPEVIEQIRLKTDGVPLFVEEVTKSVIESVGGQQATPLQLAIPATLQEALLARLDRLSEARQVAQLGATLGREFSYELLQAVSPLNDTDLHAALAKLVEAEILYQRGVGEQARYFFKHALIQDTAYQSLLKSTRAQYHQHIARVLEDRFPDIKANQPELLAHHYTEANLIEQAIPYWQLAGQIATQRSANQEAINHFTKGLEACKHLPETLERVQKELALQIALGVPLLLTKGHAAPEVETTYARARNLCRALGETPQLFPVLLGLRRFYYARGKLTTAHDMSEQLFTLAQRLQEPRFLARAHMMVAESFFVLGEFAQSGEHAEKALMLSDPEEYRSDALAYGNDTRMGLGIKALGLWYRGYPDQSQREHQAMLTLAQALSHPPSLALALVIINWLYLLRRETGLAQENTDALCSLCDEQGFSLFSTFGAIVRGSVLAEQGNTEAGILQMIEGLAAHRRTGAETFQPFFLSLLAKAYLGTGQTGKGLVAITEALSIADKNGERYYEAELYRIKGELLLAQAEKLRA
jgi:class 3 adenylate cyclase/predicted ATPase